MIDIQLFKIVIFCDESINMCDIYILIENIIIIFSDKSE